MGTSVLNAFCREDCAVAVHRTGRSEGRRNVLGPATTRQTVKAPAKAGPTSEKRCDLQFLLYLPPERGNRDRWRVVNLSHSNRERGCLSLIIEEAAAATAPRRQPQVAWMGVIPSWQSEDEERGDIPRPETSEQGKPMCCLVCAGIRVPRASPMSRS